MTNISFGARIVAAIGKLHKDLQDKAPDQRHNQGKYLSEVYFWDVVATYAAKRAKDAWLKLDENGVIPNDEERRALDPGEHSLAESPHFTCSAKISQKVRRFSADALAGLLKKQFKVPEATTKELVEKAKVPTTSSVSLSIMEKGV